MSDPIIEFVIVLIVASLAFLFFNGPFIQEPFKSWGKWGTIFLAAVIIVFRILIPFLRTL